MSASSALLHACNLQAGGVTLVMRASARPVRSLKQISVYSFNRGPAFSVTGSSFEALWAIFYFCNT